MIFYLWADIGSAYFLEKLYTTNYLAKVRPLDRNNCDKSCRFNKFNIVFFINKMIVGPNLPFHQDYFSNPQNLQNLRVSINSLICNDIQTLQSLLNVVENTLNHPQIFTSNSEYQETYKKQKELELFKYLSEQNRDRSDTVTGLAQFIMKMIDFIGQQEQRNQSLVYGYQRKIDQLTDSLDQMAQAKSLVEKDIQLLHQKLQFAEIEIDKLIEQRDYFNENQVVSSELKEELHNFKIQLLENQLNKLKSTLSIFNNQQVKSKTSLHFPQVNKSLRYTFSLDHFQLAKTYRMSNELNNQHMLMAQHDPDQPHTKDHHLSKKDSKIVNRGNRSPKKLTRYLTEHEISQENIEESQKKNQFKKQARYQKEDFSEVNDLQLNSHEEQLQKAHRLCSDLSNKSLLYSLLPKTEQIQPTKLIYITEDENRSGLSRHNLEFDFSNLAPSLQTKDSEISMKDLPKIKFSEVAFQEKSKFENKFMCQSTVVNRAIPNMMNASKIRKQSIIEKNEQPKGFYQFISNLVVKNRVKRTSQKANTGLNKFLI